MSSQLSGGIANDVVIEQAHGTLVLSLNQDASSADSWRLAIDAYTGDTWARVGEIITQQPAAGDPATRIVGYACAPGATRWRINAFCATSGAVATLSATSSTDDIPPGVHPVLPGSHGRIGGWLDQRTLTVPMPRALELFTADIPGTHLTLTLTARLLRADGTEGFDGPDDPSTAASVFVSGILSDGSTVPLGSLWFSRFSRTPTIRQQSFAGPYAGWRLECRASPGCVGQSVRLTASTHDAPTATQSTCAIDSTGSPGPLRLDAYGALITASTAVLEQNVFGAAGNREPMRLTEQFEVYAAGGRYWTNPPQRENGTHLPLLTDPYGRPRVLVDGGGLSQNWAVVGSAPTYTAGTNNNPTLDIYGQARTTLGLVASATTPSYAEGAMGAPAMTREGLLRVRIEQDVVNHPVTGWIYESAPATRPDGTSTTFASCDVKGRPRVVPGAAASAADAPGRTPKASLASGATGSYVLWSLVGCNENAAARYLLIGTGLTVGLNITYAIRVAPGSTVTVGADILGPGGAYSGPGWWFGWSTTRDTYTATTTPADHFTTMTVF